MSGYVVTVRFAVGGDERHAEKIAAKVEAVIARSKRVAVNSDGAFHTTTIEATK